MSIDTIDIVLAIQGIDDQKGKYIKFVLTELEKQGVLTKQVRKTVLDGFNNFNRAVQRTLGYQIED